ncbi:MAG: hypothetical protein I3274_05315 [Candidatus Moeniiplasma glomeromycotorum]|nr:hypothetical protein [Candidatus Moeniiplasma glomeromycotorum]
MRIEYKNNHKYVICDNLKEFFTEFIKYRNSKSESERKGDDGAWGFVNYDWEDDFYKENGFYRLFRVLLNFGKNRQEPWWELGVDISKLKLKVEDTSDIKSEWYWLGPKVYKILQEIWETGEIKNSQGLDLNWPVASKEENEPKKNSVSSPTEPSDKKSKIIWWIGGGTIFIVFVLFLIYLFRKRKSSR